MPRLTRYDHALLTIAAIALLLGLGNEAQRALGHLNAPPQR